MYRYLEAEGYSYAIRLPANAILYVGVVSLAAPWFGREVIVWVVDMAALGTAFGYGYTCFAAVRIWRTDAGGGHRWLGLSGVMLSVGFIPPEKPESRFAEWRELFGRAGLTERETRMLMAFTRRVKDAGTRAGKPPVRNR